MESPKLIVFDLNKTLIHENSWLELNMAMGVTPEEDAQLVAWGEEGVITDAQGQAILCAIYQKRGSLTRDAIEQVLGGYTYLANARETIRSLQARGYRIALLSGSMDLLVQKVATELGIDIYAANNEFIFDENNILSSIKTIDNESSYKATQLKNICEDLGVAPTDCICIGDGGNDLKIFELTGLGVTFASSDSHIRQAAKYTIEALPDLLKIIK